MGNVGWTPSTYTSSRTNRAKQTAMTVEDFMDEEDLAEVIESQQVSTKEQFEGLGKTEEELRGAGDLFDELIRPKEDTIGVQILRKMGWREGQGVGPRVKRKLAGDEDGEQSEDVYELPPINVAVVALERKVNVNGLGYASKSGLQRRIEKPVKKVVAVNSKIGIRGSMGIGVLNEDDDEDPYDVGLTKDYYSRTVVSKRDTTEKRTFKPTAKHTFIAKSKTTISTNAPATSIRRGHDGRLPLPGFTLSETPFTITSEWYPTPTTSTLTNIGFPHLKSPKIILPNPQPSARQSFLCKVTHSPQKIAEHY